MSMDPAAANDSAAVPSSSTPLKYYPSYKPDVTITGMATHPDADPEPVVIVDGPLAYQVRIRLPCRAGGLNMVEFGRTADKKGMHVEGRVQGSEGSLERRRRLVGRGGMRRVYSGRDFSFTFALPGRVRRPVLRGRCLRNSYIKFVAPKKPEDDPDSDTDQPELQSAHWD